jgi:ABC-type lipoprotein export system ATPase subunit
MEHRDRVIVVDQPEDHLDNEFVTEILIRSLLKRGNNSQIIFSTHNANIPVLGDANRVVYLGSDGQHGFVHHAGALDDDETVTAITNVMEGGREAFEKRASFYAEHQAGT